MGESAADGDTEKILTYWMDAEVKCCFYFGWGEALIVEEGQSSLFLSRSSAPPCRHSLAAAASLVKARIKSITNASTWESGREFTISCVESQPKRANRAPASRTAVLRSREIDVLNPFCHFRVAAKIDNPRRKDGGSRLILHVSKPSPASPRSPIE